MADDKKADFAKKAAEIERSKRGLKGKGTVEDAVQKLKAKRGK